MNRRFLIAAACLALAGAGVLSGNLLRNRYESGAVGMPSELYASTEAAADSAVMGNGVSASSYFDQIRQVLLSDFVDPISDESEMARGAVREMLRQLGDPQSRFFAPDDWSAAVDRLQCKYAGIGAELAFRPRKSASGPSMPLTVLSVVEGGPAAKAGLQAGDVIDEIDGKWVASRILWNDLEIATNRRDRKEITPEEYSKTFDRLRDMSLRMMMPDDALHAMLVVPGAVTVKYLRGGRSMVAKLLRGDYAVAPIEPVGDDIRIRSFTKGVADTLATLVKGRDSVTIDLRDNPGGDYQEVVDCLSKLIASGPFAKYRREPGQPLLDLEVRSGITKAIRIQLIVNAGTAREAELFASALRDKAGATVTGGPTAGLGIRLARVSLNDGSGYTLTTARFFDLDGKPLMLDEMAEAKK